MHNDREPAGGASSSSSQAAPALNRAIKSALRRLPTLVDRLLAIPAARSLVDDDVDELLELLSKVVVHVEQFPAESADGTAAAAGILDDAAVRIATLRLVAAVVKWPLMAPSEPSSGSGNGGSGRGGGGSASRTCGRTGSTGGSGSTSAVGMARNAQISGHPNREGSQAYAVLTERACTLSRLLLEHLPSSPAATDFVQKLLRMHTLQCIARQFAAAAASAEVLTAQQVGHAEGLLALLYGMSLAVARSTQPLRERMCSSHLALELRDSSVMEHAARLVLRLKLEGASGGAELAATRGVMSSVFLAICQNIGALYNSLKSGTEACAAVLEVLSGRCTRHVVLVHGVAALCMADGGPSYGMPEDVRQAVSAQVAPASPPLRGQEVQTELEEIIPTSMIVILGSGRPSPPVGVRATVLLLLRLARLAVASGDVWAEAAQQRQAGAPPHARRACVVPSHIVVTVAWCARLCAWPLLRERLDADPPDWAVAAGVECWRLVAAGLGRNVLRWATPSELLTLGSLLMEWISLPPSGEPLPPAAPPGLAAALAGGVLPCLERLLRRAGEEPDGQEATVMGALLREEGTWRLWACLLEYGELRQTAALVATLGKLLRRASRVRGSSEAVISSCAKVLAGVVPPGIRHLEAEGRHLGRLLTYAACEWLPALSDLAFQGMAASEPDSEILSALLGPVMVWLPLLAVRCGVEGGAAEGGAGAADGSGGWRLLLLEEVRVVPLLGGVLRLLPAGGAVGAAALAGCCCAVAAAFPDEVRRAAGASAWQPELLRALGPEVAAQRKLPAHYRSAMGDGVDALATMLEEGRAGGSGGGGVQISRQISVAAESIQGAYGGLAGGLMPPAEARALLRTCCHRGCTSLAGDSEADARMRWCRFCNTACYCCGECQLAHWREGGHKEACPGGAKARPG